MIEKKESIPTKEGIVLYVLVLFNEKSNAQLFPRDAWCYPGSTSVPPAQEKSPLTISFFAWNATPFTNSPQYPSHGCLA